MTTHKGSQESKEKIARAALRLFARKGYANASLEEIATLAGFTKGAVYHFFKSKEALLLALLRDIEERSIGKTTLALEQTDGGAMPLTVPRSMPKMLALTLALPAAVDAVWVP